MAFAADVALLQLETRRSLASTSIVQAAYAPALASKSKNPSHRP